MLQRITTLIALFLLLLSAGTTLASGPTVIVVGDHSPPFRIFRDDTCYGIYFDTIKELGRRMNFTPKFVEVPFKRALDMMREDKADMMPGPNYTKERAKFMTYTDARFPANAKAFYYHDKKSRIVQFDDLRGKRVATALGKSYNRILRQSPKIILEPVRSHELAIQKVISGRNDVVILPEFQGDYLLFNEGYDLDKSPFKLMGKASHICLSHNSALQNRQKELQNTMKAIVKDGTFQKILNKYSQGVTNP